MGLSVRAPHGRRRNSTEDYIAHRRLADNATPIAQHTLWRTWNEQPNGRRRAAALQPAPLPDGRVVTTHKPLVFLHTNWRGEFLCFGHATAKREETQLRNRQDTGGLAIIAVTSIIVVASFIVRSSVTAAIPDRNERQLAAMNGGQRP